MAELNTYALVAASADASSVILDSSRIDNLFYQVTVSVTAATLAGTLTFGNGLAVSPGGGLPPATGITVVGALPANVTGPVAGVFTFANPGIGTYDILLKLGEPMPLSQVVYDFTSGGGTVSLVVRAYGWRHAT